MDEPLLRAWIQEPIVPSVRQRQRPGRWVSEPQWPSPRIVGRCLFPSVDGGLVRTDPTPGRRLVCGDPLAGSDAGAWCPYGRPTDFPPDQRAEDGRSLSFTTEPLSEPLEILGRPVVTVRVVGRPAAGARRGPALRHLG